MCRPAWVQSFGPGTVREIFNNAGALTAAEPEGIAPLARLEAVEFTRSRSSAESRAKRGRMKTPRVKFSRSHQADLAHDLSASNGRFQRRAAVSADFITDCHRSHTRAAAGVHDRFLQGIVIIQTMGQCPVGQYRIGSRYFPGRTDQATVCGATELFRYLHHHSSEI